MSLFKKALKKNKLGPYSFELSNEDVSGIKVSESTIYDLFKYLENLNRQGKNEVLTLHDHENKKFIRCQYEQRGVCVQTSTEGKRYTELSNLQTEDAARLFIEFYTGREVFRPSESSVERAQGTPVFTFEMNQEDVTRVEVTEQSIIDMLEHIKRVNSRGGDEHVILHNETEQEFIQYHVNARNEAYICQSYRNDDGFIEKERLEYPRSNKYGNGIL